MLSRYDIAIKPHFKIVCQNAITVRRDIFYQMDDVGVAWRTAGRLSEGCASFVMKAMVLRLLENAIRKRRPSRSTLVF